MAETQRRRNSGYGTRLQRRAPATLQITRSSDWNVAIPFLSPLVSPSSPNQIDQRTAEIKSIDESRSEDQRHHVSQSSQAEKPVVFKKWLHPAAPFCYESGPMVPPFSFVPV